MFRHLKVGLALVAILAIGGFESIADAAETKLNFTGQLRFRTEGSRRSFSPDATMREYTLLRTRLALDAAIDEDTHVFIQFQDSRFFGGTDLRGHANSGTLNNGSNVDLHQAYIKFDNLFNEHWGFQAGRFEVNLGNQRVFGAVGWSNNARSWEGMDGWFQNGAVQATGYWLKRLERNTLEQGSDFNIYGVNANIKKIGAEVFGFFERDANRDLVENFDNDINALNRSSLGVYFKRGFGGLDFEGNGVYQFGDRALVTTNVDTLISKQDISAYLLTAEVGYNFSTERKTRLAAGVDFASGDDDPNDGTFSAYNNLYYTGHKFRGYMDYFLISNTEGLIDLMGRGSVEFTRGWKLKADVHYFMTHKEYTDFNDEQTSSVGTEIDLTITTTRLASVKIDGGLAAFMPNDSFARRSDAKTGLWGYIMVTGNFGEK